LEILKILVPLSGQYAPEDPVSLDAPALQSAVMLAKKLNAEVEVLCVINPARQEADSWIDWIPDYGLDMVIEGLDRQGAVRRRNARKTFETHVAPAIGIDGFQAAFVESEGDIRETVGAAGRFSDLIVVASSQSQWERPFRPILEAALHESARPILVSPEVAPASVGHHVVIAWNNSPEAARALAAAMPILRIASKVSVLSCKEKDDEEDSADLNAVIAYLGMHGVKAKGTQIIAQKQRPASEIIDAALSLEADLLVLGSVIHTRKHSLVYGSLTEEVLKAPRLSALLVP
tara:strand:+ start:973 stop:1842 length:870 start_codon:yes stop_codon:yes gene_type:complete